MFRWFVVGGTLGAIALALSCHAKSYSPDNGDDGGDDGDDDGGSCVCVIPGAPDIPCGGEGCVPLECSEAGCTGGQIYQCTQTGTAVPTDEACGDAGTDAQVVEENCVTTCTGLYCNVSDNCGGLCKCPTGVTCNPDGTCGNGCTLGAGEFCSNDAGPSGDSGESQCCASGYDCLVRDSGIGICCVIIGGGGACVQSTDCCDYPAAKCVFGDASSSGQCTL